MDEAVKILSFQNEFEAKLLSGLLEEMKIPHLLRSYHDLAMDGLWQSHSFWGHLEAPEKYKDEIIRMYSEMSKPGNIQDTPGMEESV